MIWTTVPSGHPICDADTARTRLAETWAIIAAGAMRMLPPGQGFTMTWRSHSDGSTRARSSIPGGLN